jgi:hypothetical protein
MTEFKRGDVVIISSKNNTESALGANDYMEVMLHNKYSIDKIEEKDDGSKVIKVNGFFWLPEDLTLVGEADVNLVIPYNEGEATAREAEQEDVLLERINYVGDYLSGLHQTEVFKKARTKTMKYDGSGKLNFEKLPGYVTTKLKFDLLQTKKVGFVRDRPDVLIMLDNSGSVAGSKIANHLRVLSGAISNVFFAELNKISLITFGHSGKYYEFEDKNEFYDQLLNGLRFNEGSTQYDLAFIEAERNNAIQQQTRPRLVILITDGVPTDLSHTVGNELTQFYDAKGKRTDPKKGPACGIKKSTLLKSIDMIASLSALSNTVFRVYIVSDSNNVDATMDRIAEECAARLAKSKDLDEEGMIVLKRFVNEMMKNSLVLGIGDFQTGAAFHNIVEDVKQEFYKLQSMRN